MRLLTSLLALSLLTLGACSSNERHSEDGVWNSPSPRTAPGTTCLPPNCGYSTAPSRTKTATSAKPTVRPRH